MAALLAGWVADRALGDPRRGHPVAGFGRLAARLEGALWRDARSAGIVFAGLLVGGPAAAVWAVQRWLGFRGQTVLLALVTWAALGSRSLGREAASVADAVAHGDLHNARGRLSALCGRDPSGLDAGELCRATVESVAENTADAIVGPLLWGVIAGPAGVIAHRCVNTLDAMVGYRCPRYARFGWASARLDDLANWVPARVTALLAAGCAPLVGGSLSRALRVLRRDGAAHPSPNAGRCEAAFAGALGVRLGGVNRYGERVELRGPFGEGPSPSPADVRRAIRLSTAVGLAAVPLSCACAGKLRSRDVWPAVSCRFPAYMKEWCTAP
jgi:adenosylcobinamide-phosphate synthase